MQAVLKQESFVDRRDARELYIDRVDVLDKVKQLVMLPDNVYVITQMVADYFEVDLEAVKKVVQRHRKELEQDGLKTLRGMEFSQYKMGLGHYVPNLKFSPSAIMFTRRSVLRIGMLLRDSAVAKQIRTYLLNVEDATSEENKSIAIDPSKIWSEECKQFLLDTVSQVVLEENGTAKRAFEIVADKMGITASTVSGKWASSVRKFASKEVLDKIRNNRGGTVITPKEVDNENLPIEFQDNKDNTSEFEELKQMIDEIRLQQQSKEMEWVTKCAELQVNLNVKDEIISLKNTLIADKDKHIDTLNLLVAEKVDEAKRWKRKAGALQESFNMMMGHDEQDAGRMNTKFKMDANGNLERIEN